MKISFVTGFCCDHLFQPGPGGLVEISIGRKNIRRFGQLSFNANVTWDNLPTHPHAPPALFSYREFSPNRVDQLIVCRHLVHSTFCQLARVFIQPATFGQSLVSVGKLKIWRIFLKPFLPKKKFDDEVYFWWNLPPTFFPAVSGVPLNPTAPSLSDTS